jgi:hypothetical protein
MTDSETTAATRDGPLATADVRCPCGHSLDRHDRVATRYCAATIAGELARGCLCAPDAPPPSTR